MKRISQFAVILATFATAATLQAGSWTPDAAHSAVSFSVKHMMLSTVRGNFNTFDAKVEFDESNPSTFSVEATADAASIDTRNDKRNAHLKSADFFDVEKFPTLTLKSKSVEKIADGRYKMVADLTIHGVTKEVTFDVTGFSGTVKDNSGGVRTGATVMGNISRKDFGLLWNAPLEGGGVMVSDDVTIMIDVELIKQNQS